MQTVLSIISHSEEETFGLGEKLKNFLREGDVLILCGDLGAGKTVFVRGLAKGLGFDVNKVNSPSYTIVHEYPGEPALYHFDLYRLGDTSELYEIGWDEYLSGKGIIVVEWGEKAKHLLPEKYYMIEIKLVDENQRSIEIGFKN